MAMTYSCILRLMPLPIAIRAAPRSLGNSVSGMPCSAANPSISISTTSLPRATTIRFDVLTRRQTALTPNLVCHNAAVRILERHCSNQVRLVNL
jgi:hypothetical protein